MSDDADRRWFAVYTNAGSEFVVAARLRNAGYAAVNLYEQFPVKPPRRNRRERLKPARLVRRPVFPRYVLAGAVPGDSLGPVYRTVGVHSIVSAGAEPLAIPYSVVAAMRARGNADGLVNAGPRSGERYRYRPGEAVAITDGAFTGFTGIVIVDKAEKIQVQVEAFAGHVTAAVPPWAVKST